MTTLTTYWFGSRNAPTSIHASPPKRTRHTSPPDVPPFDFAVVNAIIDQLNEPDPAWWDQTDRLDVPTLIIGGGPDSPIPQELLTEVAARMPDATMITISAGHHVRASQPAAFLTAVSQFLANPATG